MPASMISIENLSKRYLVGHRGQRSGEASYTALRDVIGQELRNFGRKAGAISCADDRSCRATRSKNSGR